MARSRGVLLVPRAGVLVRDPDTRRVLAADGERRELTTYWRRRLRCGDVLIASPTVLAAPRVGDRTESSDLAYTEDTSAHEDSASGAKR